MYAYSETESIETTPGQFFWKNRKGGKRFRGFYISLKRVVLTAKQSISSQKNSQILSAQPALALSQVLASIISPSK